MVAILSGVGVGMGVEKVMKMPFLCYPTGSNIYFENPGALFTPMV